MHPPRANVISLPTAALFLRFCRPPIHSFVCKNCLQKAAIAKRDASSATNPPSHADNASHTRRPFTTSTAAQKKTGGKQSSKQNTSRAEQYMEKSSSDDPGNFSAMKDEISLIAGRLREDLKKIKAGGLDVDAIESLRVRLKDSSGGVTGGGKGVKGAKSKGSGGEDVRLGDVAQVIPRGRVVVVSVGEKDYIKPVTSALSAPPIGGANNPSSTPFPVPLPPSPDNPLEIHLPVPPTTAESRRKAITLAHEKGEAALHLLREARGAQKKRLRALELSKKAGPDNLRRAEKELEQINQKAKEDLERIVKERQKSLERA